MTEQVFKANYEVTTQPMTRQEYNDFRGWELPSNEDGSDKGYLVKGTGHTNWLPEEQVAERYVDVTNYTDRMLVEANELATKIDGLNMFIEGDVFKGLTQTKQVVLTGQLRAMNSYAFLLEQRIKHEG